MVREIMKDPIFLGQPSQPATEEDRAIGQDLLDTLEAHKDRCVGMAANMIGQLKRVIVFDDEGTITLMFNPKVVKKTGPYRAAEGCLSLPGLREAKRWKTVKIQYQNEVFQTRFKTYTGYTAQIVQHEIDHCDGVLI